MDASEFELMPKRPEPALRILSLDREGAARRPLRAGGRTDRGHVREHDEDQHLIAASQGVLQERDVPWLCPDGLHSQVGDGEIVAPLAMLERGESPQACAAALVDAANAAGGVDNVTVVGAQC